MRRWLIVSAVVAAASIGALLWLKFVDGTPEPLGRETIFFWAGFDPARLFLALALLGALALFVVMVSSISLARRIPRAGVRRSALVGLWIALIAGAPVVGVGLLIVASGANATYTEIEGDTLTRDLVVREWSFLLAGGGTVFERDGALLTAVGTVGADDGYMPFADGAYSAREESGTVTLRWVFEAGQPMSHLEIAP